MQKIVPHLWFNKEAVEAANFYVSVFGKNSKMRHKSIIKDTPSGDCDIVSFTLWDYEFQAISAGPYFKLNPSISLMVNFDPLQDNNARERIDEIWEKLAEGGKVLMPLDTYPFSERYGWIEDKYGVSWQLILTRPEGEERPLIIPALLFTNDMCGKAEETTEFYLSIFKNTRRGSLVHYESDQGPNKQGSVMFTDVKLENQWFAAMDGGGEHHFSFNEAFSFIVNCETQEEIDYYWHKLSAVPEAEQCGWLKDKYGVSWQIVPTIMNKIMTSGDQKKIDQVTQAFLKMKKFDIQELEKVCNK